jgi:uncharacterized protein YnzC (UPF0291/DUF896 family)
MTDTKELDEKLARFAERAEARKPKEAEEEQQRQEDLRQSYLNRTGRKSLTP